RSDGEAVKMRPMHRTALAGLATAALIAAIGCGSGASPDTSSATVRSAGGGQATAAKGPAGNANWPTCHGHLARTGVDGTSPPLGQVHRAWAHSLDAAL